MMWCYTTGLTVGLLLYTLVLVVLGMAGFRLREGFKDFVTAGAGIGVLLCALSLVSTIIGSSATIGMGALVRHYGSGAYLWMGVGVMGLLLHGWLIAPKVRRLNALSLPHVVEKVAGRLPAQLSGGIIAVSWLAIVAAQFAALHVILLELVSPTSANIAFIVLVTVILLHTALSGQRGVIYTDALQAILLVGGFGLAAGWLLFNAPETVATLDWQPTDAFTPEVILQLGLVVGFSYVVGPDMFSRSLSAKSAQTARWAAWSAAPLLALFGVIIVFLGLMNLENASPIAGWLADDAPMPVFIKVMLALGLMSALSGSVDTVLFSTGVIVEHTVLGHASIGRLRFSLALLGAVAAIVATLYPNIIGLLLSAYGFFVPGVAVPLFVALVMEREAPLKGWLIASSLGGALGLSKLFVEAPWAGWLPIVGMAVSGTVMVLAILVLRTKRLND